MENSRNPLDQTMPKLIREAAAEYDDTPFLIEEDGAVRSFEQLESQSATIARALLARGIAVGDRVAIWAPNSGDWVIAACAIERIGAIMVPINTRFKGSEAGYILAKSGAKLLFTVDQFLGNEYVAMLRGAMGGKENSSEIADLPHLKDIVFLSGAADGTAGMGLAAFTTQQASDADLEERERSVTPQSICDILFTSGTTGNPKGAMHNHGQALWMVDIWNRSNDLRRGDRMLIVNPFFHSFGYRSGWVSALYSGITAYPCATFDVDAVLRRIESERITILMGPPTIFNAMLDHPQRDRFDLSSLRVGHTGSSNVPVSLIERVRDELAYDLFLTSYGLTEATALVSVNYPNDSSATIANTVGHALPGTSLKIIDAEGNALPDGESGELLVRGPNVMQGYFEDPAATAEAIDPDGWLHTGDVGLIGPDGTLRIVDRLKDIIIVGGFNAYPAEIEHVLITHPAIAEAAVVAIPDARMGEVCGACVVLRDGAELGQEEFVAWARERLANFKVPRHLFRFDALPRTPLGKIQKFLLRKEALERLDLSADAV